MRRSTCLASAALALTAAALAVTAGAASGSQSGPSRLVAATAPSAAGSPVGGGLAGAAQRGGRPVGLYTGGAFGPRFVQFFSLRLSAGRRAAAARATVIVTCRGQVKTLLDNVSLSQIAVRGGRAKGSAPFEEEIPAGSPGIGGLTRSGLITYSLRIGTGGRAGGTIRNRFKLTDPATGEVRARCDSGRLGWSARLPARSAGAGKTRSVGPGPLFGVTGQRLPFLMRVLPGGRAVRPAGMTFRAACPSTAGRPLDLASKVKMRILRRKRFGSSGSFQRRFTDPTLGVVVESYRWKLAGRFGANGARGTWRVDGVVRDADTRDQVGECTTGRNRWRAVA